MTTFRAEMASPAELDTTHPVASRFKHFWGFGGNDDFFDSGNWNQPVDWFRDFGTASDFSGLAGYFNSMADQPVVQELSNGEIGAYFNGDTVNTYNGCSIQDTGLSIDLRTNDGTLFFVGVIDEVINRGWLMGWSQTSVDSVYVGMYVEGENLVVSRGATKYTIPITVGAYRIAVSFVGTTATVSINGSSTTGTIDASEGSTTTDFSFGATGWRNYQDHPRQELKGGVICGGLSSDTFTAAELDDLTSDPYQIFRTAEDAVNDYGLKWGDPAGNEGGMIDISGIVGDAHIEMGLVDTLPDSWSFLVDARHGGAGTGLFLNRNGGISGKLAITEITNFKSNGTPLPWVSDTGNDISLAEAGTLSFDLSAAGHGNGIIRIGSQKSPADDYPYRNLNLRFIKITDDNGLHYIDLNRTQGNPVDLTGNLTCTLAGFPTESGYVYENGEIVGYKMGTDSNILTLTNEVTTASQTWTLVFEIEALESITENSYLYIAGAVGNVEREVSIHASSNGSVAVKIESSQPTMYLVFDDGAFGDFDIGARHIWRVEADSVLGLRLLVDGNEKVAWTGVSGNLENIGVLNAISSLSAYKNQYTTTYYQFYIEENDSAILNLDFTTGDVDSIPDTVNGNNADIINAKTSGWMPISQKQVFTIRANGLGDYSSMSAAVAAQAKNLVEANETQEFLFFNDWPTGLNDNHHFSGYVTSPNNWLMLTVPESERCVGGDITTGFHIKNDVNSNPPIRPVPGCEHIMVTGLGFSAGSGSGFAHNNGGGKDAIVQDCTFNGVGVGSVANGNASYKRNYIIDTGGDGILATQGFCHYLDNIVVRAGNRGLVTYGDTVSANNLIYNSTGVDISNQGGTLFNNVTSDNTGDIPDIDFTGAFADG